MRILIISTIYNSTPPNGYGGIQRVVHYLTEALAELGHEIILIAPPRSWCSGRTIHVDAYDPDQPWKAVKGEGDLLSEEPLYEATRKFLAEETVDVIHDWSFQNLFTQRHPDAAPFIISTSIPPGANYSRQNLVACSKAHANLIGGSTKYVHYGLPLKNWAFDTHKTQPAVHIAKIARFKAQHLSILAALRSRSKLTIAGNIENQRYYNWLIRPLVALSPGVRYIGEIDGTEKHLLQAAALLQTPRWFDCFPLVVLEALACATPIISLAEGGVVEQIQHGKTGFLCKTPSELAIAFQRLDEIDPMECRRDAESRFSNIVMAQQYISLYKKAIDGEVW